MDDFEGFVMVGGKDKEMKSMVSRLHPKTTVPSNIHKDVDVNYGSRLNCFAIDVTGRWCALGGKSLHVIDLEAPYKPGAMKTQSQAFQISVVEWNPHHSLSSYFASAASQEITVWSIDTNTSSFTLNSKVSAHTRPVSDFAWNPFEPHLMATCSADGNVCIWDLRDLKKSSIQYRSHSPPSKIRWCRGRGNIFASSHDRDVHIYDLRKENTPQNTFTAHVGSITSIDWSYLKTDQLLTSSQDKKVKVWDTTQAEVKIPKYVLETGAPVSRARFSPFGKGIVTAAQHSDTTIKMWIAGDANVTTPVHVFSGHSSAVRGLDWRIQTDVNGTSDSACQLMSFANDDHIRLWAINSSIRQACHSVSRSKKKASEVSDFIVLDLGQEFHIIKSYGIPGCTVQELDVHSRIAEIRVDGPTGTAEIKISFPQMYPRNAAPSFEFLPNTTFSINVQSNLRKMLSETAHHQVESHQPCLQQCLSKLVLLLKHVPLEKLDKEASNSLGDQPSTSLTDEWAKIINEEKSQHAVSPDIVSYKVKPTDTLTGIALNFNMKPQQIKQVNNLFSDRLIPGQILYLRQPGSTTPNMNDFRKKRTEHRSWRNSVDSPPPYEEPKLLSRSRSQTTELTKSDPPKSSVLNAPVPEEVLKHVARYCSEKFNVTGMLTLTSQLLIFEPNLTDNYVEKDGVLPYQIYLSVDTIFDCQVIPENPAYHYDTTLELSTFSQIDSSVSIYDFILDESRLRAVYKKLMGWISLSKDSITGDKTVQDEFNLKSQVEIEAEVEAQLEEKLSLSGVLPELTHPSSLLTKEYMLALLDHLPARFGAYDRWNLLYGTQTHGISLNTFYTRLDSEGPSILIVEDNMGNRFGGFASDSWRIEARFYGSGESFLFKLKPEIEFFHWKKENSNFQCSRRDFVAIGGGSHFGLWIDSDFQHGSSNFCETYGNTCLSGAEDFLVTVVEVWGFSVGGRALIFE